MKNYSRQREAIVNVLRSVNTHPTAAEVYKMVRESIPNISLGTVYRNLAELSSKGEILKLSVGDGHERFDGDVSPHLHLTCRNCGLIEDLPIEDNGVTELISRQGFIAEAKVYLAYGLCKNCQTNR